MASAEDELFGELRSLFQRQPSLRAWYRLAQLSERWSADSWHDRALPYISAQLGRAPWSALSRPCPQRWIEALERDPASLHPAVELITELTLDRGGYGVSPELWMLALGARRLPQLDRLVLTRRAPEREGSGAPVRAHGEMLNRPTTLEIEEISLHGALWSLNKMDVGPSPFERLIITRADGTQLMEQLTSFEISAPPNLRALELRRAQLPMEALHRLAALDLVRRLDELGLSPQCLEGPGDAWEQPEALARALFPDGGGPKIT